MNNYFFKLGLKLFCSFFLLLSCSSSSNDDELSTTNSKVVVTINSPENNSDIYLDGVYTGKTTPNTLTLRAGDYTIGIGQKNSKTYLKKSIKINTAVTTQEITLTNTDIQDPKIWKTLFVGVNNVKSPNGDCVSTYSTEQLDAAFDFFKFSFTNYVEPYTYNTTKWEFDRRDINTETVVLDNENVLAPSIFESHIPDLQIGDYDLVVTFFNGGKNGDCFIQDFIGLGWFNAHVLSPSKSAYNTIRYYGDIENAITQAKQNDPGVFIHEWLHTVVEIFYPDNGGTYPNPRNGSILHAAPDYDYAFPWMTWYEDLLKGKVKSGSKYVGIGPESLLNCTVRASAKGNCN